MCRPVRRHCAKGCTSCKARALAAAGLLSSGELELVGARVEEASYRTLQSAGVPLEIYAARLLDDLRSHNWDRQNPAASALATRDRTK